MVGLVQTWFQAHGLPLSLRKNNNKGRYVAAERDVKIGEVILVSPPYAAVVQEKKIQYVCDSCFKAFDEPLSLHCPLCSRVFYCSSTCQHNAEDKHTLECPAFKQLDTTLFDGYTFSIIKLIIRLLNYRAQEIKENNSVSSDKVTFKHVSKLVSNTSQFPLEKVDVRNKAIDYILSVISPEIAVSKDEITELWCKEECNSFGLWRPRGEGLGLYPMASFFNHSCLPNVLRIEEGSTLVFKAITDVPANAELCLSYINPDHNYQDRQAQLKEEYYFACDCARCEQEKHSSLSEEFTNLLAAIITDKCPNTECGGSFEISPDVHKCNKCGLERIRWNIFSKEPL